jgi:hypothetical protein
LLRLVCSATLRAPSTQRGKRKPTAMGILIGYAGVSTGEQNLDLQIDALEK